MKKRKKNIFKLNNTLLILLKYFLNNLNTCLAIIQLIIISHYIIKKFKISYITIKLKTASLTPHPYNLSDIDLLIIKS